MTATRSFTGRSRERKTRSTVRIGEVVARLLITVGGIGTIIAVGLIAVFLVWVVYPLFLPASVNNERQVPAVQLPWKAFETPVYLATDEDQVMAWALFSDGSLQAFSLESGKALGPRQRPFGSDIPTAWSGPGDHDDWVFGFADGTVRQATIDWSTPFVDIKDLPPSLRDLPSGEGGEFQGGLLRRSVDGRFRLLTLSVQVQDPITLEAGQGAAVHSLDHVSTGETQAKVCVLTRDHAVRVYRIEKGLDLKVSRGEVFRAPPPGCQPVRVLVAGTGDRVDVVCDDGRLYRYAIRDLDRPRLAESVKLIAGQGARLTALQFLSGKATLMTGDSTGQLRAWFGTRPLDAETEDKLALRAAHTLPGPGAGVTALAASSRTPLFAAGYTDGRVRVYYPTSEKLVVELETRTGEPVRQVVLAPRNDGVVAVTDHGLWHWQLQPGHPEVTLRALFLPVWYEDYSAPETVWQSSGGEPKLGLWPLIFGTLKATLYSLLIGVPLALMAAVYSSEYLHPRVKNIVKPSIELMACLPSVVLGFLAALVFAPLIDRVLPVFLMLFVTVPLAFLLGAYIWQLLPEKLALRLVRWRLLFVAAAVPAGFLGAVVLGPVIEQLLFAGDFKHWLSGLPDEARLRQGEEPFGSGIGGWLVLLLPCSAIGTALFVGRVVNPWLRRWSAPWRRTRCALADLGKFLLGAGVAVLLAWFVGATLTACGYDPRGPLPLTGPLLGAYSPLNSLIVGCVMGFAIIPIVYTIAEDALSAVPEHLRAASLGCGATPWQTATRIVIPTAMSGLFSAVMVGLGRAVGETMIVLMAAGGTPLKHWNVFDGFRSLSACIAIEMPEAVRGSTHYRTLYLAGLVLFALTFALNTAAEIVRLRFRKRAYQL
jgi:phosphate transport system permease protein